MRVFSHGSNVNFQTSTREMLFSDLECLLQNKIQSAKHMVLGIIDPSKGQLEVCGRLSGVSLTDATHSFIVEGEEEPIFLHAEQLLISQEAVFTIDDEKKGQIDVAVLYITYEQKDNEVVYFVIDETVVTHPMSCVVQFYEQVKDVGRDVDFSLTGCTAHEWKPNQN